MVRTKLSSDNPVVTETGVVKIVENYDGAEETVWYLNISFSTKAGST